MLERYGIIEVSWQERRKSTILLSLPFMWYKRRGKKLRKSKPNSQSLRYPKAGIQMR